MVSLGDILLAAGVAWFLFSAIARGSSDPDTGVVSLWRTQPRSERSIISGGQLAIDRPVVLGGGMGPGFSTASASTGARHAAAMSEAVVIPVEGVGERIRRHPYVRLARDARFSAFWLAGTVSLFGDRLHQIALGVMVLGITGSALQTGLVFLAATLPNLLLGPVAGTFVDRWDQKRVMIASDLLRAGLVLLLPFIAEQNVALVYPVVFGITTISLFFRPAKAAIVPRIVDRERPHAGQRRAVDGRDHRRHRRLPAGGRLRRLPGLEPGAGLLGRLDDLPRERRPARRPRRAAGRPRVPVRVSAAPWPRSSPSCRTAGASCGARPSSSRTPWSA